MGDPARDSDDEADEADSSHGSVLGPTPSTSFEDLIASILLERNKDLGDGCRLKVKGKIRSDLI